MDISKQNLIGYKVALMQSILESNPLDKVDWDVSLEKINKYMESIVFYDVKKAIINYEHLSNIYIRHEDGIGGLCANALANSKIRTIEDLHIFIDKYSSRELFKIRNFGIKSYRQLIPVLEKYQIPYHQVD
jgi:hypothetical protein